MHEDFQKWKKMQFSQNAFYLECMQIHCLSTYESLHSFFLVHTYILANPFFKITIKVSCNKEIDYVQ